MTATADFIIEIGTEELPPRALRMLEQAFATHLEHSLGASGLAFVQLHSFATPRRLAVLVTGLALKQPARHIEKKGPPVSAAFSADGKPTRAAEAFAASCGVELSALERLETPKGSWLMYRAQVPGQPASDLLCGLVSEALAALPIPRRMRWGSGDTEFVRPVHWVLALLGDQVLKGRILDLEPGRTTRGHRYHAPEPLCLDTAADYPRLLMERGRVIVDFAERRSRIAAAAAESAASLGGVPVADDDLLDEVASLVEWPVPVSGRFDPAFLELPEEVLMATLQAHQRYFPVRGPDGQLMASFIAISNLDSADPDQVRRGNERVVRPRLADAAFFWSQDGRAPLAARVDEMQRVIYQRGLGSLHDKAGRMASLATRLAGPLGADTAEVERAAWLSRTDLLTEMVGEFPELQGIMGRYYAGRDGEPAAVAAALAEQYLPRHAGDRLPETPCGLALALADRLDTLAGVFALGKRPSGNKDPYGLRRAALGLMRILVESGIELDLVSALREALVLQPLQVKDPESLVEALYQFVVERSRAWYLEGLAPGFPAGAVGPAMFESVRLRKPASPLDFHARLQAVHTFMQRPEAESLAAANKRIANILRGVDLVPDDTVDPASFREDEERRLYEAILAAEASHREAVSRGEYAAVLETLTRLRGPVDAFFDKVLVMSEDPAERANRLALLGRLRAMFLDVADFSQLPAA